ncbi:hypothetical protein Tco_0966553 [Tanacetum coccineum]
MGELTVLLRTAKCKSKGNGFFNSQDQDVLKDEDGKEVVMFIYLDSMIGFSLVYLILTVMKTLIFCLRNLKGVLNWALVSKDFTFDLIVAYSLVVIMLGQALLDRKSQQEAKTVNREVQLQALVDGKKIIITELIVRRGLQLEDADGVDCLPNATIFKQLTLIGYEKISQNLTFYKAFFSPQWKFLIHTVLQCLSSKTTAWNEFSSTMASAIICLATNQKFNFSKYIFESMVKYLDNVGKFLMYPRFVQVFLDKQVDGMASHKRIYIEPSHTKKIFGNIRRVGKGFSRRDTPLFQTMVVQDQAKMGEDEAVNEEMDDSLVRVATTATSLDAEQDRGNINKTRSKATLNEPSSLGTSSGSGPRCQETMGDTIAQTRFENVSKHSNDPLLVRANEIASLKRRVKKLERRNKLRTHVLKRLYIVGSSRRVESSKDEGLGEEDASKQGRIADIDANKDIYLVNVQTDEDMFGVNDLDGDEVIVESVDVVNTAEETRSMVEEVTAVTIPVSAAITTTTTTPITDVEITLAQALAELKSAKPKADKVVIQEPEQGTTTTPTLTTTIEQAPTPTVSSQQPSQVKAQDKGKGKMVKPELVKKMSKKDLLGLDEELAFKLQAEEEEEERLAREKAQQVEEANIAWDDVQDKIEVDYQLAQRLQAQEQEELTDEEKTTNKSSTKEYHAYLSEKHRRMEAQSLKNKSFANIQELFDKAMKRVNTFVYYRTELVEESSKKAEVEIAHGSSLKRAGEELE